MKALALIRWELVQAARGLAPHLALTIVSLFSAGLVGVGIVVMSLWSPFTQTTPAFPGRPDSSNAPSLLAILGEYRGGATFLIFLAGVLAVGTILGPALSAGPVVRERQSGRVERLLTDASRSDVLALAKLLATLVPLGLIVLAAAPSLSFAWLVGGLPMPDAIASAAVVVGTLLLIAAVGLLAAALATSEVIAVLASYCLAAGVLLGPFLAALGLALAGKRALADGVASLDPFVALLLAQPTLAERLVKLAPAPLPAPPTAWLIGRLLVPVWAADVALDLLLAAALVWLVGVALDPLHPIKTWRLRRQERAVVVAP
jgi:hypothetical protein